MHTKCPGNSPGHFYFVRLLPPMKEEIPAPDNLIAMAIHEVSMVRRPAGRIIVIKGADKLDLLHRISTNDLAGLAPGSSRGTIFISEKGRIIDYVRILVFDDCLWMLASPGKEELVMSWIEKYTIMEDVSVSLLAPSRTILTLFGPKSVSLCNSVYPSMASSPGHHCSGMFGGIRVTVDYDDSFAFDQVDVFVLPSDVEPCQTRLNEANPTVPVMTAEEYDCFRIVHGVPQNIVELSDLFNPYEVNLRQFISFTKGCYIGQEVIARLDTYDKIQKHLVALIFKEPLKIEGQAEIVIGSDKAGWVTSVSAVPKRGTYPALAVLKREFCLPGLQVSVTLSGESRTGTVLKIFGDQVR